MSEADCQGLPHLCCNCKTCNVRRMTSGFSQVWGRNVNRDKGETPFCPGWVIDVQARGSLYILWRDPHGFDWYVQKRTLDGEFLWNIQIVPDVAGDFVGHRIDSDDTTVWVCAMTPEFTSQKGFFAYSADDGSLLWTKIYPHYDVDPDGAGGCVAAMWASPSGCSNSGTDTILGNVRQYDADGTQVIAFGDLDDARSVLVQGDKVWVGGPTTANLVYCFCPEAGNDAGIKGCVMRHALATGEVELVCAGGEWIENVGTNCKVQVPIVGAGVFEDTNAYVTRLTPSASGGILCGVYGAGQYDCMLFTLNSTTGRLEDSYDITSLRTGIYGINSVMAMAVVSSETWIVVTNGSRGGLLVNFSSLVKTHRGYLTDLWPSPDYIVQGSYSAVSEAGGDLITGGEEAGCVLYDDTVTPGGVGEGSCDQPCECGDFNTRGQAVVGCGCEDGVDPTCAAYLNLSFTGCLVALSGVYNLLYDSCPDGFCDDCSSGNHHWYYRNTVLGKYYNVWGDENTSGDCCEIMDGVETENCSDCCITLEQMAIDVCYDCVEGWILKFCITTGFGIIRFTGVVDQEYCDPPSFTFTWDGTLDSQTGTAGDWIEDCCGGTAGCGGFNREGCGPSTDCCGAMEATYPVSMSSAICPYASGVTGTATWNPAINAFECVLDVTTAGGLKTWGFSVACPEAGGSASDFVLGPLLSATVVNCEPNTTYVADFGTAECSPLSLTFTNVQFAHNGFGVCCDDGTPMSPSATATIVIG